MSAARRLLILGGIALALLGMIYGGWYAVFAEHQELDGIGGSLTASFTAVAVGHAAVAQSALEQYREQKYDYDRHVDVHGHWIGLAMLLMVLGVGLDRLNFSEQRKTLLAAGSAARDAEPRVCASCAGGCRIGAGDRVARGNDAGICARGNQQLSWRSPFCFARRAVPTE